MKIYIYKNKGCRSALRVCGDDPVSALTCNLLVDRVPAEAMQEFFGRFERALQFNPKAMLAA